MSSLKPLSSHAPSSTVQPEPPNTQCQHHRDGLRGGVGAVFPECDEEGRYRSLQCHGSTGHCWCVSDQGQERAGTRTPAGSPRPNCDEQGENCACTKGVQALGSVKRLEAIVLLWRYINKIELNGIELNS